MGTRTLVFLVAFVVIRSDHCRQNICLPVCEKQYNLRVLMYNWQDVTLVTDARYLKVIKEWKSKFLRQVTR